MQMNRNDQMIAQRAETLRLKGAYEQAIGVFEQLQKEYPENAWINAHLGAIYYQLMDYGKAEDYLKTAVAKNNKYLWAHAQLGETYRLRAIAENRDKKYVDLAIEHFKSALGAELPENSHYPWALAHLGATYRLEMTRAIENVVLEEQVSQQSTDQNREEALKCLNRSLELIPTYAWAWGMRATVYRLAQEYEDSFWDLGVETVIAPEIEILQHSSSPVPFLESRRVNLHEHAFLCFYLTKTESDPEQKSRYYSRAAAFAQQALIVNPGDLIADLILIVIEANQKREEQGGSLSDPSDINSIKEKLIKFCEDADSELFDMCEKVLRHLIRVERLNVEGLRSIRREAGENHKLTRLILNNVIEKPGLDDEDENSQLWLWKNFALTETCSSVLILLSDLSCILKGDPIIGSAYPYRRLAEKINHYFTLERLYQTPTLSSHERLETFTSLCPMATKVSK